MNKTIKKLAVVVGLGIAVTGTSFAKTVVSIRTPIIAVEHKTEHKAEPEKHHFKPHHHNDMKRCEHKKQIHKPAEHHSFKPHNDVKKNEHKKQFHRQKMHYPKMKKDNHRKDRNR